LRSTDTLFRYGRDEFIAFLNDADVGAANELAAQIDHNFQTTPLTLRTQGEIYVDVRIATVGVPQEGQSLGDLIRVAQRRLGLTPSRESTIH
jgi:diguanylate cyclase (GGDEF)-like protein